ICTLHGEEFMRRFLQHVLPKGLHKVRYFGLWHPNKRAIASKARLLLHMQRANQVPPQLIGNCASSVVHQHQSSAGTADLRICPPCAPGHLLFVRKLRRKQPQAPCHRCPTQFVICACWPRHALAQSCSSFRRQFPPHWGHDARSQSSLPSAFTPTSAPLTPFPRHPRLKRHSRPPEISIYVLPPTKRRARVGQPSFCAGFAAQKLLIRYGTTFDRRVRNIGIAQVRTPFRSPRANAIAERWVRSVRTECLDHVLIFNERHLQKVLAEYVGYFNDWRPHRSIGQRAPCAPRAPAPHRSAQPRKIIATPVLGGLHHVYQQAA